MKIQLTKTKTIEIGGRPKGGPTDVVGIEFRLDDPRGCPAVRLARHRGAWRLVTAGFVPVPSGKLPDSWDELGSAEGAWSLPAAFQAPTAAIAIDAPEASVRQTTMEGVRSEPGAEKAAIEPGKPVSLAGRRFVTVPLADEGFVLQAGLPEYQVQWLGRLFPEGRRPTVSSVQIATLARVAALTTQPGFIGLQGVGMSMIVSRNAVHFAGWNKGRLALLRQCPGRVGWGPLREEVKTRLGLDDALVDEVLDGSLVDPCSAMEPFVRPILRELALSVDYLVHRIETQVDRIFLMGLPSGAGYWNRMAAKLTRLSFTVPQVFDGLEIPSKKRAFAELSESASQDYLGALGAARALMEDPA